MNDPKKVAAPAAKPVNPVLRESLQPEKTQYQLLVRFYARMRRHRVYPFQVSLQKYNPGRGVADSATPVTVRPMIPGAVVTPAELELRPGHPESQSTFYVTPMAKGSLRGASVQLLSRGSVIQQVATPCRSVTQRLTLLLGLLTILVTALLLYYLKFHPLEGYVRVVRTIPNPLLNPTPDMPRPAMMAGGGGGGGRGGLPKEIQREYDEVAARGTLLAYQIKENLPALKPRDWLDKLKFGESEDKTKQGAQEGQKDKTKQEAQEGQKDKTKQEAQEARLDLRDYVADGFGTAYDSLYGLTQEHQYPIFRIGMTLLAITIASWVINLSWRSRRRGAPVVLPN
jgi:hypothetical protein